MALAVSANLLWSHFQPHTVWESGDIALLTQPNSSASPHVSSTSLAGSFSTGSNSSISISLCSFLKKPPALVPSCSFCCLHLSFSFLCRSQHLRSYNTTIIVSASVHCESCLSLVDPCFLLSRPIIHPSLKALRRSISLLLFQVSPRRLSCCRFLTPRSLQAVPATNHLQASSHNALHVEIISASRFVPPASSRFLTQRHQLRDAMASPVASSYPQPLPSPPPIYLPSSPPLSPSQRESTPRSNPSYPQNTSVAPKHQRPPVPSVSVNGHIEPQETPSAAFHDDSLASHVPNAAFSNLSLEDNTQKHGVYPPRKDSVGVPLSGNMVYRHTPASSISSFAGETQTLDERQNTGKTSGSPYNRDVPSGSQNASSSHGSLDSVAQASENYEPLQYHHRPYQAAQAAVRSTPALGLGENSPGSGNHLTARRSQRPRSAYSFASDRGGEGGNGSPHASPYLHPRTSSRNSSSPDVRPVSFVDLLNAPYPQPGPAPAQFGNSQLRSSVGNNASLLSHKQTFDMYLGNVKKTDDAAVQYEFAVFMVNAMLEMPEDELEDGKLAVHEEKSKKSNIITRSSLLKEAKSILQRLADRSYPFAQYYLADGYASGLFHKGKEDYDRAFPLFVAASKHGHVEACYRTALCYEFGWGTRVEASRAQQFYRQAASKNHPGAMLRMAKACLAGDMGLGKRYREGIKWLKRAAESSDAQYNSAPYELGLLHESGYGDDVFEDPSYAAQLFTKSADLGHVDANYRLGDAYEHGKLNCPRDPALSIHFYTTAAQGGHPLAMMALCAWYLVGAEPVLDKDENEAYEWAKQAAELGLAKAQYAVGYFTEMGIGCRRDPLEANVWYVKAADQGDTRAIHRIAAIRAAADGVTPAQAAANGRKSRKSDGKQKRFGIF